MKTRDQLIAKFNANIKVLDNGCHEWTGNMGTVGYGQFYLGKGWTKRLKEIGAHRAAYLLFVGPLEEGKYICHRCDNRRCVNYLHLFQADAKENMQDHIRKGRQCKGDRMRESMIRKIPRGERHYRTKFTEEDVINIRRLNKEGIGMQSLAEQFKVHYQTIYKICSGKRWRHVH